MAAVADRRYIGGLKRRTLRKFSAATAKDHHNVYVVLLAPAVGKLRKVRALNPNRDVKKPCVYVGLTGLPPEERGRIMKSHIEVGRRYPEITINTTYSYGIDDQEFVVCFEGDDPGMFLDLVNELRPTDSSEYTELETPIFTCVSMSPSKALDALDGTPASAPAPAPTLG